MSNCTLQDIAGKLLSYDNIMILTHKRPDGDTLGSAYALCMALRELGKKANILTESKPQRFNYLFCDYKDIDFAVEHVVSVDVAQPSLFAPNMSEYIDRVDIRIDHHEKSTVEAPLYYVEKDAPATAQIIYDLVILLGVEINERIALGIYTGLTTDTGCFKYSNTTPKAHEVAMKIMPLCDWYMVNNVNFQIKKKDRLKMESLVLDTLTYCANDKCAIIDITLDMKAQCGNIDDSELEGISSIPNEIEGVLMGLTIREQSSKEYKISCRTDGDIDASAFCIKFGGGGHKGAGGCTIYEDYQTTKNMLIKAAQEFLL